MSERWTYVPAIADLAAPTLAELEAGQPIRMRLYTGSPPPAPEPGGGYTCAPQPMNWIPSCATATWTWIGYTGEDGLTDQPYDILDRIDDTLAYFTDAQHSTGEPWPYESF